jgi:hypothetical protein
MGLHEALPNMRWKLSRCLSATRWVAANLLFPAGDMRQYFAIAMSLWCGMACGRSAQDELSAAHRRALADSVVSLFDSLAAIHRDHPDTGLLRRLHPPADTVLFIEGPRAEAFTGDSLFRRVLAAHIPVRSMTQRFSARTAHVLDSRNVLITAREAVEWIDTAGAHRYGGVLSVAISRKGDGWVIRAYHGS